MSGFEVTAADLVAAHTYVGEVADELRAGLGSVTADVDALMGSAWKGSAAAGFAAGWQDWQHGAEEVLDALARMGALLADTARTYAGHEAAATQGVRNVDVGRA